jgi:hypothetical protein
LASQAEAQTGTPAPREGGSLADIEVDVTDEPEPEPAVTRSGTLVVPRVGFVALGWGKVEYEHGCSSIAVCESETLKEDYDDDTMLLSELAMLFHLGPQVRLGGGLLWVPSSYVKPDNGNRLEWGMELAPLAIAEGVFGGKIAGTLRGFIGPALVFADGDLEELVDVMDRSCGELGGAGLSCSVDSGPFLGLTLGAGGGVLGRVNEQLAMRADLTLQYHRSSGPSLEADDGLGDGFEDTMKWSVTRMWMTVGVEF